MNQSKERKESKATTTTTTTAGCKKPKSKPKTVMDKIIVAIRAVGSTGGKGASRIAITKYLQSEYSYTNTTAVKSAFKRGVSSGELTQSGQSFRVTSDPVLEVEADTQTTVKIEDTKIPSTTTTTKATAGDTVTVSYVGTLDDGTKFDSANKFEFVLGAGEVIKGWDIGVEGMKVGGERKLTIPSKLGYGKRGSSPDIPPNATLHFVIKLKKI